MSETAPQLSQPPASGSGLRLAGVAIGGIGIAALVTGGVFSYLVSSAKQKAEDNAKNRVYDSDLNSRGHSYETLQWVSYGAGAGLLATGAILYLFGAQGHSQTTTVSLVPSMAPGHTGVLLQGRY